MNELISIIVPIYNAEKHLKRCIDSLCSQQYQNIEIILINDGSTDNSKDICEKYSISDSRIFTYFQENKGVSAARNLGIEKSNGTYLSFVDADDELPPDSITKLVKNISQFKADISIGTKAIITSSEPSLAPFVKTEQYELWQEMDALNNSLEDNPYTYSVWGKLYKKEFIADTRFTEGKKVHEDAFFLFELFLKKPTVICQNICVYYYYLTPNSASRTEFSEKFFDILYFANKKMDLIKEFYPELIEKAYNVQIKANMAMLANLYRNIGNKYHIEEKKYISFIKKNKQYFIPATTFDKRWFFIITHNAYSIFKQLYHFKYILRSLKKK